MLEQLKKTLKGLLDQRNTLVSERKALLTEAEADETRDALTEDETRKFNDFTDKIGEVDDQIAEVQARVDQLEAEEARAENAAKLAAKIDTDPQTRTSSGARHMQVTEPRTYRPGAPTSFFADAYRAEKGDWGARKRLERHMQEARVEGEISSYAADDAEQRDVGTGAFGSLVVPAYLVDEFAEVLRNGRAYANSVRRLPLPPSGTSVIIPRGQTGTTTAPQATENTAVSETDADFDNDLTVNVRTFAGQQDVSRQSLERGTADIDSLVYADLVADYAEQIDSSIINDDGTSGTHKGVLSATGINAVTYTDTSPTVAEAWPKIADGVQRVAANRKLAANLHVMHPRRWGWFIASLDSQNRPLVVPDAGAAINAMGTAVAEQFGEGQLVGTLQGLPVLVDANIATDLGTGSDEDRLITVRRQDQILWEEMGGMPRQLRFEETTGGSLTVKLVVYGYSAFTAERHPEAVSVVSGTGLTAPTF